MLLWNWVSCHFVPIRTTEREKKMKHLINRPPKNLLKRHKKRHLRNIYICWFWYAEKMKHKINVIAVSYYKDHMLKR